MKYLSLTLLCAALGLSLGALHAQAEDIPPSTPQKSAAQAITVKAEDLLGRWEAEYNKQKVMITFLADNKVKLGDLNQFKSGTYTVDLSTTPMQLTLTIDKEKGFSIFEMTADGIRIARPDDKTRPTKFGPGSLVFRRAAEKVAPATATTKAPAATPKATPAKPEPKVAPSSK